MSLARLTHNYLFLMKFCFLGYYKIANMFQQICINWPSVVTPCRNLAEWTKS